MPIHPGALTVIALYTLCLVVIWYVAPRLAEVEPEPPGPWWRSTTVWGSFVAVAQIVIYAIWS